MATETAVFAVRSDKPCFSWASCTFCNLRKEHSCMKVDKRPHQRKGEERGQMPPIFQHDEAISVKCLLILMHILRKYPAIWQNKSSVLQQQCSSGCSYSSVSGPRWGLLFPDPPILPLPPISTLFPPPMDKIWMQKYKFEGHANT